MDEFGTAFHQADRLYLLDIYAASEPRIEGVTSDALLEKVRAYGHRSAEYVGTIDEGVARVAAAVEPGDLVITLGAGNVSGAAERILERLREKRSSTDGARRGYSNPAPPQFRWSRFIFWLIGGGVVMLGHPARLASDGRLPD